MLIKSNLRSRKNKKKNHQVCDIMLGSSRIMVVVLKVDQTSHYVYIYMYNNEKYAKNELIDFAK